MPCNPAKACTGGNACGPGYRYLQEQCRAYYAAHPSRGNCTTNAQCQNGSYAAAENKLGDGYGSCDLDSPPENCAVCDFTGGGNDGQVGRCRCLSPARCGRCTLPVKYPNGKIVKGHFMIDGECKECPPPAQKQTASAPPTPQHPEGILRGACFWWVLHHIDNG